LAFARADFTAAADFLAFALFSGFAAGFAFAHPFDVMAQTILTLAVLLGVLGLSLRISSIARGARWVEWVMAAVAAGVLARFPWLKVLALAFDQGDFGFRTGRLGGYARPQAQSDLHVNAAYVLGDLPDAPQPAQKMFESLIWSALRGFDPARLGELGGGLEAGEFVMPGSFCSPTDMEQGDEIVAEFARCGRVSIRVA